MADTDRRFWVEQQGRLAELWLAARQRDAMRTLRCVAVHCCRVSQLPSSW